MKKIILISLLTIATVFNAGCTDDEVTAGAIGVIIGIGLGDSHDHNHGRRPEPYRPGRPGRRYYAASTMMTVLPTADVSDVSPVNEFALKHHISVAAAEKVQAAFADVKTEGITSFAKIGLQKKDVEVLMAHSMLSTSALGAMAVKLDMSEAQARDFVLSLNREFSAQAADVASPYWEACMAKGKWKTPENMYCTSTRWTGCAPETGASLCF